ncbi:MAG: S-methyl-5-thioribose-1-phosphate isomerase, partial [Chloroflexi bacterium]|nr:S-methyl-5-thioribose-1-phosphate isomerase [Chloroflexota bacterium]
PISTIDLGIDSGPDIPIEERSPDEVTVIAGKRIAPEGVAVANPAFDITPSRYITGIITDMGVAYPSYEETLPALLGRDKSKA